MTAIAPTPMVPTGRDVEAQRLTRWSWLMLPAFLLAELVSVAMSIAFLHLLDLQEGDVLLWPHSVGAWAGELAVTLVAIAAPVAGVSFATAAARRHPTWPTWVALAVNTVLLVLVLYRFVDDIRMAY